MADAVLHGTASYPGVAGVVACEYTCSHGISPGCALLTMQPQDTPPAITGDLVISDGSTDIVVKNCRVADLRVSFDAQGYLWHVTLFDRRWTWKEFGSIDLLGNQLDPNSKLVPWSIFSPTEIAILCLQAMGETNYSIDLPPGLAHAVGAGIPAFLPTGVNFPPTGTNAPVNWNAVPPFQALQQLCDQFGRRLVYRVLDDTVMIAQAGVGALLPPGSVARQSPGIKNPQTPDVVGVVGAPTVYQMELNLQAVGKDWDGRIKPIDDLSYAPDSPGLPQITNFAIEFSGRAGLQYQLRLNPTAGGVGAQGRLFAYNAAPTDTPTDVANALAAKINVAPPFGYGGTLLATVLPAVTVPPDMPPAMPPRA